MMIQAIQYLTGGYGFYLAIKMTVCGRGPCALQRAARDGAGPLPPSLRTTMRPCREDRP